MNCIASMQGNVGYRELKMLEYLDGLVSFLPLNRKWVDPTLQRLVLQVVPKCSVVSILDIREQSMRFGNI